MLLTHSHTFRRDDTCRNVPATQHTNAVNGGRLSADSATTSLMRTSRGLGGGLVKKSGRLLCLLCRRKGSNNMPYSNVYDRLVKDERDITGLAAYGLYKKNKREFIRKKQEELGVTIVPEDMLEEFYAFQTDFELDLYRQYASTVTREFIDEMCGEEVAKEKQKLESEYLSKYNKLASSSSFWSGVLQGIVASFLFVLAGYIILKMNGSWDILLSNLFK